MRDSHTLSAASVGAPGSSHAADERPCCTRLIGLEVRLGAAPILENVNLHIHCGECTAIVGPNGAGKTTLLRALIGELPHGGRLIFTPAASPEPGRRPRIGYVPQRMELDRSTPLTVRDLFAAATRRRPVWLGASRELRATALAALERVNGAAWLDWRLGQLSCGQMQRVLLALALVPVPELLLLDEPLAGMDRRATLLFYRIVSELRRDMDLSILLVSHDLETVTLVADRLVLLNRTVLEDGPCAAVLATPACRELFGLDLTEAPPAAPPPPIAACTLAQEEAAS